MIATTATQVKEQQEVQVSESAKTRIIAICCLSFFPVMYVVGKALVNLV